MNLFIEPYGIKAFLWTHLFVSLECPNHSTFLNKGPFVNSTSGTVNIMWWNGNASYINFTNSEATV